MFKRLIPVVVCLSLVIGAKAEAQVLSDTTQVTSIKQQSNGQWMVVFARNWVDEINVNMMVTTVKDFSCQTKLGTIINVQGNIGINVFNQPLNQQVNFYQEGDIYGQAIAPYCQNR